MSIVASKQLDCRHKDILVPILKLRQALQPLRVGEIVEVLSDDPSADMELTAWSRLTGHTLVDVYRREDFNRYFIQKER